jgi:hypothetical protein
LVKPEDLEEYAAFTFTQWPISLTKKVKVEVDTVAIESHRFELLQLLYTTLDVKTSIVEEMINKYPECSKKAIERFLKEISIKEKRDGDELAAYYATPD